MAPWYCSQTIFVECPNQAPAPSPSHQSMSSIRIRIKRLHWDLFEFQDKGFGMSLSVLGLGVRVKVRAGVRNRGPKRSKAFDIASAVLVASASGLVSTNSLRAESVHAHITYVIIVGVACSTDENGRARLSLSLAMPRGKKGCVYRQLFDMHGMVFQG
jgi:hypothetical protein